MQETLVWSLGWEGPLEEEMQSTALFFPGESHGQRSLGVYSPWGRKELDMTEHTLTKLWVFLEQMAHLEIVQPE